MTNPNALRTLFLDYMQQHNFKLSPKELFDPVEYILQLGGKRLRPTLLLMCFNLYEEDSSPALPAAYAYEIFHNFSLVHDDIMDEAPLRRGKPTIHQKYDINTGILSGDVMLIYAYEYLLRIDNKDKLHEILSIFTKVATEVCIGQQQDMNFETSDSVKIEDYLQMIASKTAALLAGGMQTGAILGGASKEDSQHLYEFGRNLGIAFQLQDDILDTFGDAATFGKRIGGDIVQNKKTFLVLKSLEIADPTQEKKLRHLLTTHPEDEATKIAAVKQLFNQLDIRNIADKVKDKYHQKALVHLASVSVPNKKKKYLEELAESLLERVL